MTATAASTNICFNTKCGASVKDGWRRGWRLRSGDIAKLCDRCGYAYEQVRFCEDFHSDTTGWRNCGTCGKLLHCGCIASVDAMLLLDTGGVECIACAKKNGLNVDCNKVLDMENPSSCSMENKVLEDLFRKDVAGGFKPPCQKIDNINLEVYKSLGVSVEEYMCSLKMSSHVKGRQIQETGTGALIDELEVKKHVNGLNRDPAVPGHNVIPQSTSLKRNSSIAPDLSKSFQQKCATSDSTRPNGSLVQRQRPVQFSPNQYSPILNANLQASREIENHISIARNNGEGRPRNQTILSRYWPRITGQELQQISGDSNSNIIPLFEKTLSASDAGRIGRLVLPKKCAETYFPTISHPEGLPLKIQDANGKEWIFQFRFWPNNNSRMYVLEGVTSCIQSMQLQAGDVVTFSRINPEGKLLMGFRKASTVTPDQDIQLVENPQNVGEISSRIAGCNEVVTALPAYSSVGTVEPIQDSPNKQTYSSDVCSVEKATGDLKGRPVLLDKKKSRNVGPKKRRFCVVTNDFIKLKLQWNEAQGYLQPPPNYSPSIVVIGGHEFEEYEEPPILGKQALITEKEIRERAQWVQCVNCSKWRKVPGTACLPPTWVCSDNAWDPERSSCSSAQEISTEQLEELSSKLVQKSPQVTKKRKRKETPTKLDELADLALLDGNELHPPMQPPTTRHPRHRDGCSCIVCIQPPSGQGPKHEPSCTCNVCLTVKRRFRTLMLRRKKLQSEKVTENAQRNYQESPRKNIDFEVTESDKPRQCNPSTRDSDVSVKASDNSELLPLSLADKGEGPNIGKGQIDLNSHPEDFSPHSGSASMLRPFHDSMWMGVQCSSVGGDEDTDVRAIDTFDKSNVSNGDHVFKPGSLYTDTIGGSEVTDFSAQAPETSAM